MLRFIPFVISVSLLAGCLDGEGSNPYAALYDAPTRPSSPGFFGTWGGAVRGLDTRWVLLPNQVTLANKCGNAIVGVDVAAEVTTSQIRFLESARSGGETCFVNLTPGTITACPFDGFMERCFVHAGKQLTIYESELDFVSLTKIED